MKKVIKLLLFSVLSLQMVVAQKTITGVVSDNEGLPLPGATILVQGTSTGVTTDFDGNFSITAEEGISKHKLCWLSITIDCGR